ncbi:MAG TPA: VanW family protein [Candidatus Limnocylindria bacterium]
MTTDTPARTLSRPFARMPSPRSMLVAFVATLGIGFVLLAASSLTIGAVTGSRVMPGVSVGAVSLAGLDRAEAEARLSDELPSVSAGQATVTVAGEEFVVGFDELGRHYDWDAMLDAAFAVGRGGDPVSDAVDRLRAPVHATSLPVVVNPYDADALAAEAHRIAVAVTRHPVEAAVIRDGTDLTLRPSRDGGLLTAVTIDAALRAALEGTDPADVHLALHVTRTYPIVDTATAARAAAAAAAMMQDLELAIPGAADDEEPLAMSADQIASWVSFGPQAASRYAARIDRSAMGAAMEALAGEVDRSPVDARFTVAAGGGLAGVIVGVVGREVRVDDTVEALSAALESRASRDPIASVPLPVTLADPALTTETALAALPQMRLVSSWTTNYVPNDGNGFGNNISIGAWDLDGYTIAPGEWFSFWGGIGPVTLERGYRYGGAIINGRSVPNGALAGGICSTSTTLFNAAMRFGLEIGERENHFYYIDRYPTGLDATVAIVDSDVTDMTFRNDTDAPIVIRGFGTPGQVTFQLWSVPNGRSVVLGAPTISNQRTATDTTQLVPSMAPGSARRVEFPHNGFDASVSRWVYAADGSLVHQNTWFSDYRAVNGITLVGPPAPAPPEDEPDEDG